jgi:hypothetical protein
VHESSEEAPSRLRTRQILLSIPLWLSLAFLAQATPPWQLDRVIWGTQGMDGRFNLWVLSWVHHALTHDPLGMFDANIFYPARDTLALGDHKLANQLLFAPAYALTGSPIIGTNAVATGQFVLAGLATMLLAHRLSGSLGAAIVAGAMFAFSPVRMVQLGRPNLLVAFWTPLALYFLDRFLDRRAWRDLLAGSLCVGLQFLAAAYHGYFLLVAILVWVGGRAIARSEVRGVTVLARVLLGLALAGALVLPFSLPYFRVRSEYGALQVPLQSLGEASADWRSYIATRSDSLLYGSLLNIRQPGFSGGYSGEKWLFPGLLGVALAALGLAVSLTRSGRAYRRVWLPMALAATAFVLSFGPTIRVAGQALPSPYLLLWHFLPGFSSVRVPARFAMLMVLGLSLSAAVGYRWIQDRLPGRARRLGLVGLTLGVVLLESMFSQLRPGPVPTRSQIPEEYRWLATHGVGALLELPSGEAASGQLDDVVKSLERETWYMFFSVFHWRPLVNGYSGYPPAPAAEMQERVAGLPSTESLRYLQAVGVRQILVHPDSRRFTPLLAAVREAAGVDLKGFPSGAVLVTLPDLPRGEDVDAALVVPGSLRAAREAHLAVRFTNPGSRHWVNPTGRTCRVALAWTLGSSRILARAAVLPPVALSPGESRERSLRVDVPVGRGPASLHSTVTCHWDPRSPRQWARDVTLHLTDDLRTGDEATEGLDARYVEHHVPPNVCAGCPIVIRLHARNTGTLVWKQGGLVRLGLLWTTEGGSPVLEWRVGLARDVYPGQVVPIVAPIPTPRAPGHYRLTVDLLQEGKTWFMSRGVTPVIVPVTLTVS